MTIDALREQAWRVGVETSYWDVEGRYHEASEATLRAVVEVLEDDAAPGDAVAPVVVGPVPDVEVGAVGHAELVLADGTTLALTPADGRVAVPADLPVGCHQIRRDGAGDITVVVPPTRMPRADAPAGGASLFVPVYALWEESAPLPSFAHLVALAAAAHRIGIGVVSTLPLYAAFLDEPFDPSPYAPMSRLHWNELYLDDAMLPAAEVPRQHELVDWHRLAARRRRQLLDATADLDPFVQAGIDRLVARRPDVMDYAHFRATHRDAVEAGSPGELVERSHLLAQYLAGHQLDAVEGEGRALLALDLPIGSHAKGYETWAHPDLFASGMTVGSPPDEFFTEGQDWGFPPQLPGASRRAGHTLWRRLVANAGQHASVLRIDHVMGVHRLWWIPEGMGATEGVYVRYPREELLAVIAAEATCASTTIVGEDLGTVPDEVSEALRRWDVIGMYEEQFAMADRDESFAPSETRSAHTEPLPDVPARSVAGIRTHDMPAFAAAFADGSVGRRYRQQLADAVGHPVADRAGDVLDAALERLAASAAYLTVADLDDLLGLTAPHNVPGRILQSTWRRRLPRPTSAVLGDPEVRRRVRLLVNRPAGGAP